MPNRNVHANRIDAIDTTRGILFTLMTSTHASTLATMYAGGVLRPRIILPRGWATTSFIMLSGYTIAAVYPWWQSKYREIRKKLQRRAKEILLVMFVSNLVSLCLQDAIQGNFSSLQDPQWWLGLITFETQYTTSAILLPTAFLLLIVPWLQVTYDRIKSVPFAFFAIIGVYVAWMIHDRHMLPHLRLTELLFLDGMSGFPPIVPFLSLGIWGFAVGFIVGARPRLKGISRAPLFFGAVFALAAIFIRISYFQNEGVVCIAQFALLFLVGSWISSNRGLGVIFRFLPVIGRYALFSFVCHRLVMQGLFFLFEEVPFKLPANTLYSLLLVLTLGVVSALCILRERHPAFDTGMKKVYL